MKYLLILTLITVSCQSKKTPLEGKWVFDKNELFPGVVLNAFQDSMINVLNETQKGLTLTFKGSNFKASLVKDGRESPMGNQPFSLTADQKLLVLKNKGRANDTFPIVFLSDNVLKLNMFHSKDGYPVFRKIK